MIEGSPDYGAEIAERQRLQEERRKAQQRIADHYAKTDPAPKDDDRLKVARKRIAKGLDVDPYTRMAVGYDDLSKEDS